MKKVLITLVTIVIIGALSYAAYVFLSQDPDNIVQKFYDEWMSHEGDPVADRLHAQSGLVTEEFTQAIDDLVDSFEEENWYDPVLCSQEKPRSFTTVITDKGLDHSSVKVILFLDENQTTNSQVGLVKNAGGKWRINSVECISQDDPQVTNFAEEGNMTKNEEGEWALVYEKHGSPALSVELELSSESKCLEDGIATLCFTNLFEEGMRVRVTGEEEDGVVRVATLEFRGNELIDGVILESDPEDSRVVILMDGGIEAMTIAVNQFTEIYDRDMQKVDLEKVVVGDSVSVRGLEKRGMFVAEEVRITKSATSSTESGAQSANADNEEEES